MAIHTFDLLKVRLPCAEKEWSSARYGFKVAWFECDGKSILLNVSECRFNPG